MKRKSFLAGLILLGLILLGWSSLPAPHGVWQATFQAALVPGGQAASPSTASELRFSYPRWARAGQTDTLQLTVKASEHMPSNELAWVARVEMPGTRIQPDGLQQQAYLPGEVSRFRWTITPLWTPFKAATVWLYLQPAGEGGVGQAMLVASYPFSVQDVPLMPAGGWHILRWAGVAGLILGLVGLGLLYKPRLC